MNPLQSDAGVQGSERIAALEAQVLALRAEMQSLTATISHDLRAPLRHITSFAQLVQDEAGPQLNGEMREFLATISGSAKTLGSMLDGLLALSRIGTATLHPERVSLAELVQDLVQERQAWLQVQAPARRVVWSVDAAALPEVMADAKLLHQALALVLDNAVQFTALTEQAEIGVSALRDPVSGQVHCTVRDNGAGFVAERASQLFRPFVRLHSSNQFPGVASGQPGAGQGMGLALVRKCMQRLGAEVTISAAVQEGCQVVFMLPGLPQHYAIE